MSFRTRRLVATLGAALLLLTLPVARAQIRQGRQLPTPTADEDKTGFTDAVTVPVNRQSKQLIQAAQDYIAKKEWGTAAECLQQLLEDKQDSFIEIDAAPDDKGKPSKRRVSVRNEANRLIGELPPDGLQMYQVKYGQAASESLKDALEANDPARLAEVAQRVFAHQGRGRRHQPARHLLPRPRRIPDGEPELRAAAGPFGRGQAVHQGAVQGGPGRPPGRGRRHGREVVEEDDREGRPRRTRARPAQSHARSGSGRIREGGGFRPSPGRPTGWSSTATRPATPRGSAASPISSRTGSTTWRRSICPRAEGPARRPPRPRRRRSPNPRVPADRLRRAWKANRSCRRSFRFPPTASC